MTPYQLQSKIYEIRTYIASDWPTIEERKKLYEDLKKLELLLKVTYEKNNPEN